MDQAILINALVELAALEAERDAAAARLAHCRRKLVDLAELGQEFATDAEVAAEGALKSEASLHNREVEIQALEQSLAHRRAQLKSEGDERLREVLGREIAALEERCDRLLDDACALLGRSEREQAASAEADRQRNDQERRRQAESGELGRGRDQAAAALQEIEAEIARLGGLLPDPVVRDLKRLWQRGGTAVVTVQQGACGGCFSQLPPQQAASADQGKALVRCPSCARFVVHKPWH